MILHVNQFSNFSSVSEMLPNKPTISQLICTSARNKHVAIEWERKLKSIFLFWNQFCYMLDKLRKDFVWMELEGLCKMMSFLLPAYAVIN